MKAVVFHGVGDIRLDNVPEPKIQEPSAQVIADRFHVMKQVNDELDRQIKKEKRQAETEKNESKKQNFSLG